MSHTPGPWTFSWTLDLGMSEHGDPEGVRVLEGDSGTPLLTGSKYYPSTPEKIEDWLLMAAAPDLLAALKAVVAMLQEEAPGTKLNGRAFDQLGIDAHNAIAKAEGR